MLKLSISVLTLATLLSLNVGMTAAQDMPEPAIPGVADNPFGGNGGGNNGNNGGNNGGDTGGQNTNDNNTGGNSSGGNTTGGNTTGGNTTGGNTNNADTGTGGVLEPNYDQYVLQPQYNPGFQLLPVNNLIRRANYYKRLSATDCGIEAGRLSAIPASGPVLADINDANPIHVVELCPTTSLSEGDIEMLGNGNIVGLRHIIDRNDVLHDALSRKGFDADNVVAIARGEDVVYIYVHNAG